MARKTGARRTGTRRTWADLTTGQRIAVLTMAAAQFSLAIAAWRDLARRPAEQVRGTKPAWAAGIAVNWVGPLAYFRWGRR